MVCTRGLLRVRSQPLASGARNEAWIMKCRQKFTNESRLNPDSLRSNTSPVSSKELDGKVENNSQKLFYVLYQQSLKDEF